MITERISTWSIYEFENSLDSLIKLLEYKADDLKKNNYSNSRFDIEYEYDGDPLFVLKADRLETDKEYEKRLAKEKNLREVKKDAKLKKQQQEKEQLQKLLKKYPDAVKENP